MAEKESQIIHLRKENQLLEERNRMLLSFSERTEVVSRNMEHQQVWTDLAFQDTGEAGIRHSAHILDYTSQGF